MNSLGTLGRVYLGGVYMIPVRVSFWYEFIPVLTYRSVFVYMIPVKNLIPVQLKYRTISKNRDELVPE